MRARTAGFALATVLTVGTVGAAGALSSGTDFSPVSKRVGKEKNKDHLNRGLHKDPFSATLCRLIADGTLDADQANTVNQELWADLLKRDNGRDDQGGWRDKGGKPGRDGDDRDGDDEGGKPGRDGDDKVGKPGHEGDNKGGARKKSDRKPAPLNCTTVKPEPTGPVQTPVPPPPTSTTKPSPKPTTDKPKPPTQTPKPTTDKPKPPTQTPKPEPTTWDGGTGGS